MADAPATRMLTATGLRALRLLARVPRSAGLPVAAALGRAAAVVSPRRPAVAANMARVLGAGATGHEVDRLVAAVFANQARNYFDLLHFAGRDRQALDGVADVSRCLRALQGLGDSGAVAVTLHYGNLDIVGQVVGQAGVRALAVVERIRPPALFHLVTGIRARTGLELVPVDRAPRLVLRAVRARRVVVLAADRDAGGGVMEVPFFGAPALVPYGYARLALRAGVPLLLVYARRGADQTFTLHAHLHRPSRAGGHRAGAVEALVRHVLCFYEDVIASDPAQWVLFHTPWPPTPASADAPHRTPRP